MEEPRTGNFEDWQPTLPPWRTRDNGRMRRVGIEIELIGPDVEEVTAVVAETVGGQVEKVSRYEMRVHGDKAGSWRVELDFNYLVDKGREQAESEEPASLVEQVSEALVRTGAEAVVPVEIISPPLPMPRLAGAEKLVHALRRFGALGTRAGLTYAFGMQLNPEMPRCDVDTIRRYLQSFLCLQDWLLRESRIDLTRKLTGYTAPFPADYIRRVIEPEYRPDLAGFIDDYLTSNPTRNRALDLLPLFAELDNERLWAVVQDERVKARPTLHYRLPNCEVDEPGWGIHVAWNQWLQVECMAADSAKLAAACKAYARFLDRPLGDWIGSWADGVEPWLASTSELPITGPR